MGPSDDQHGSDPGREIVKYGQRPDDQGPSGDDRDYFLPALLWCSLGAVATTGFSVIGVAMVAYGFATALSKGVGSGKRVLCALGAVAGALLGTWYSGLGVTGIVESLVSLIVANVMARLVVRNKATVTTDYLVAAVLTALTAGFAWLGAKAIGSDLGTLLSQSVSAAVDMVSSQYGLEMAAQMRQVSWLVQLIWPLAYFLLAGASVLAGHAGARIATLGPDKPPTWNLGMFEAPTWSVVALIVAVALFAFSSVFGAYAEAARSIGLSLGLAVRFIFMMQGFAVLSSWLNRWHTGCLLRFVVMFLAIDLEVSFFIVSVLGLVDYWANFRHVPRGGSSDKARA